MSPGYRWFEDAVIGFLYLTGIVVGLLEVLGVNSFAWVSGLDGYAAYVIPVIASLSYLLGATITRVQAVGENLAPEWLKRLLRGKRFEELASEEGHERFVRLLLKGTQPLIDEIQSGYRTLRLFRSLAGAVPFVGLTTAVWLGDTDWSLSRWPLLVGTILATVVLLVAHRKQYRNYFSIEVEAKRQLAAVDQ
jgi:hypothetical protein